MEQHLNFSEQSKQQGRPLPKRGQIKAGIFWGIAKAVVPVAFKNGGNPKKSGSDGGFTSDDATPATKSGYTSGFDDDDYR